MKEPAYDLIDFCFLAPLLLRLGDVERIDAGKAHCVDAVVLHELLAHAADDPEADA